MKYITIVLLLFLGGGLLQAQDVQQLIEEATELATQAEELVEAGEYEAAARKYLEAAKKFEEAGMPAQAAAEYIKAGANFDNAAEENRRAGRELEAGALYREAADAYGKGAAADDSDNDEAASAAKETAENNAKAVDDKVLRGYERVDEDSQPPGVPCDPGGTRTFSVEMDLESLKIFDDFKIDTVPTDKDDWEEADEQEFDEEYNKEKAEELEELKRTKRVQHIIDSLIDMEVSGLVEHDWNKHDYQFCLFECNDPGEKCYISWKIRRKDFEETSLRYVTNWSYVFEEDDKQNTVEVEMDVHIRIKVILYFEVTCACLDIPAQAYVEPGWDPYWSSMDLTEPRMKVPIVLAVPPPRGGVPIWIPITGGAAAVATAVYFIVRDGEPDDPGDTPLVARDDVVDVPCDGAASINVLTNDSGDGLNLLNVTGVSGAQVTWTADGNVTIEDVTTTSDFSFEVSVGDQYGQEATSTVSVNVSSPEVRAVNDEFETPFETPLTANVLTNDIGGSLIVTDHTVASEGVLTIDASGNLDFIPPDDFEGTVSANYMIEGPCGKMSEATVSIIVNGPDCSFTASVTTTPANCGAQDGTGTVEVDPAGDYTYDWSNGQTGNPVDLGAGDYMVTVTSSDGNCVEVLDLTVDELPPDFVAQLTVTNATCGQSDGMIEAEVTPDGNYQYEWSGGQTTSSISGVPAGQYSVTITIDGTDCALVFDAEVAEEPPGLEVTFSVTDANCGMADGSIEATVIPDDNYTFEWSNGATGNPITDVPPGQYTLTVTLAGTMCSGEFVTEVGDTPASFTGTISFIEPHCGVDDGAVTVDVLPDGDYTYAWSNGSNQPVIEDIGQGDYCVTVTDALGCSVEVCETVTAQPAEYISQIQTIPGNCIGEGSDVILTLMTPGAGPMEIVANGPDGTHMITAPPGVVMLSSYFTVLPGAWSVVVRDQGIDPDCNDQDNANVEDNSSISAMDDAYETVTNQMVSGNVLTNDSGVQLKVISNTDPGSGTLTINEDGSFDYEPAADFEGEVTFEYTVMDACGNTTTATVTIVVNSVTCTFTVSFDVVDANCGVENGSITPTPDPPGVYTYDWSNGSTDPTLLDVPSGEYNVTVTSQDLNCDKEFVVEILEEDNSYLQDSNAEPGNCIGDGEIEISITTPGSGPITVEVDGPGGLQSIELPPGTHQLSNFFDIASGNYILTIYDNGAGPDCAEIVDIIVDDDTPDLIANDDAYITQAGVSVSDDFTANDDGLNIEVTDVFGVTGGDVTWDPTGSFTFDPEPGFVGEASFFYSIIDACGNVAEAEVTITVEAVICDFILNFNITNANCGLEDGVATTTIDPPGNYSYQWSDGSTTADLVGVPPGDYGLTVTDNDLGCDLEFSTTIGEDPSDYISDVQVIQPSCTDDGDIVFTVSTPGTGAIEMDVTHPNGTLNTVVPEGQVVLSDYIAITPGDFTITITEVAAGVDCSNSFDVTLDPPPPGPTIAVEAVFPPSSPTADDGSIVVAITSPSTGPYTILLDDIDIGTTADVVFTVDGLGAGFYNIQIVDANGCVSNILNVEVPISSPGLQLGVVGLYVDPARYADHNVEQPATLDGLPMVGSAVEIIVPYSVLGHGLRADVRIGQYVQLQNNGRARRTVASLDQMAQIARSRLGPVIIDFTAGVGLDLISYGGQAVATSPHWAGKLRIENKLATNLTAGFNLEIAGWDRFYLPTITFGVYSTMK